MAYIGKKKAGSLTTLPELAEWMRSAWPSASETYLSNVIQRMARGGLLRSHRGVAGGYSLTKPAAKTTLRDVVEVLEGVDLDRCSLSLENECPAGGHCSIQRKLTRLEMGYLKSLEGMNLAQLAKDIKIDTTPLKAKAKAK